MCHFEGVYLNESNVSAKKQVFLIDQWENHLFESVNRPETPHMKGTGYCLIWETGSLASASSCSVKNEREVREVEMGKDNLDTKHMFYTMSLQQPTNYVQMH